MLIAQFQLADRLPTLARQFPELRIQLHVTDRFVDLVREGFDVAVRRHYAALTDSDLVRRRMRDEPITLVSAPSNIAQAAPKPVFYADESVSLFPAAEMGLDIVCLPKVFSAQAVGDG
ncbi:LysR substrate-binding domain-containing protein [Achromobacter sp.]|uniref:LysR substrate-binding domain-containing protein n=1 Tax=Achromobacter sp. TaxID=134375 RepID=UPI0028B0858E|nr:LysR substrate-binding domain-containing protein [Achromobacter sp.]